MLRGDKVNGAGASPILTKPSGLTRATFGCLRNQAYSYSILRRFPEALRKLDQVLNIIPDDVDTLAYKGGYRTSGG